MHAAVIATLTYTSTPPYSLTVGGTTLIGQDNPTYKVPIESIQITEEGPGGVSGLDFGLWDPDREVVLTEMAWVEFWDVTNNLPKFAGFVQSWGVSGVIGRTLDVHCIGIEAVLDWMIVPSLTVPNGIDTRAGIQSVIANATGIGVQLRAFATTGAAGSSQATPIGDMAPGAGTLDVGVDVVLAGETVREACRKVVESSSASLPIGGTGATASVTIDFWYGVRTYPSADAVTSVPSDYAVLTVVDTVGAGTAATILDHQTDAEGVPHAVFVDGGNAAGTGLVSDGSGIPGPVATITDDTILTSDARDRAATAYMSDKATAIRGTLGIENFAPTTNIRAGSWISITSTVAGLSSSPFRIASITKRFIAARQTWTVAYGGFRPSYVRQIRRLTRTLRS